MKILFLDHDGVICLSNNWGGRSKKWAKYRSANPDSSPNLKENPVFVRFDDFDKIAGIHKKNNSRLQSDAGGFMLH